MWFRIKLRCLFSLVAKIRKTSLDFYWFLVSSVKVTNLLELYRRKWQGGNINKHKYTTIPLQLSFWRMFWWIVMSTLLPNHVTAAAVTWPSPTPSLKTITCSGKVPLFWSKYLMNELRTAVAMQLNISWPEKSSLVFPVGINVLLPFRIHEIVT